MCLQQMLMNFVPWCLRVGESKRIPTTRCMEELQRCMKMSSLSCRGVEKRKLRRNDWIQMRKKQLQKRPDTMMSLLENLSGRRAVFTAEVDTIGL